MAVLATIASGEGTFLFCTCWLAHALAFAGEIERAREVFGRAAARVRSI